MRLALLLAALVLAACKGDAQKCEQACRHHAELVFWRRADAEIASAPADQQRVLRQKKQSELSNKLEQGVEDCVVRCRSAHNDDQADCVIAAKTVEAARECLAD